VTDYRPDYLVIGHVTIDVLADGRTVLGGTAAYGSATARNLGRRVALLTACRKDLHVERALEGIRVRRLPSPVTTTFRNDYHGQTRRQYVFDRARRIVASALPAEWSSPEIVHLGPIAQDVDEAFLESFPNSLLGATPQGWMRDWDGNGRVRLRPWPENGMRLDRLRVVVIGEVERKVDPRVAERLAAQGILVVVTAGPAGATVYDGVRVVRSPGYQANEVDPTGAGDVFAAAFLVRYQETSDAAMAAEFANCAAALSVEKTGLLGIPTRAEIERHLGQR
jgi:sugar/nucleoside kinase (ribokinase family)